jgi:hypothetical protein
MARDVEHFFIYILAILTSSFENGLFSLFAHFFFGSLIFDEAAQRMGENLCQLYI